MRVFDFSISKNHTLITMIKRSPVVVVMGHVDHGKTTLLDYIRKTNVASREAGGITQSIGAYEIIHKSERITFIDTPGHEAFSKMRARGASVADIAILVVAADSSVQPQTKEAYETIQAAKIPFIVAINKIDRVPDVTKVKNDLMQIGILLEGYGGNISCQNISAKTGEGVPELLDLILLTAEVENLTCDLNVDAQGIVLESHMDRRRGATAVVILENGTLRAGDNIKTETTSGKIRTLEDFMKKSVKEIIPSSPAIIIGLADIPKAGESFVAGKGVLPGESLNAKKGGIMSGASINPDENFFDIVVKADTSGSLETIVQILNHMPIGEKKVRIISSGVGDITDSDVRLALPIKALVLGFRVRASKPAESLARDNSIPIAQSEIIYELTKVVEDQLMILKKALGILEVLAVFGKKDGKQIIGGRVIDGEMRNQARVKVKRGEAAVGEGKIVNLQQGKVDATKVVSGLECGILFDSTVAIAVGDSLVLEQ